jgi:hypothetical protein
MSDTGPQIERLEDVLILIETLRKMIKDLR